MPSSISRHASHDRRRVIALWAGILSGPVAFLLLLEYHYVLSYVACETRQTWFLHAAAALAIALVAAAGIWAWRAGIDEPMTPEHASPPLSEETSRQRVRWMVIAAALFSAWFIILIAAMEIPIVVLRVCD